MRCLHREVLRWTFHAAVGHFAVWATDVGAKAICEKLLNVGVLFTGVEIDGLGWCRISAIHSRRPF